ncbi:hypothetical protein DL769_006032 [Monosporascus sp. CRB-8-3]|nr:hypothetical protein DL769_006032 [Monosporascus sp. CRB-8-3]
MDSESNSESDSSTVIYDHEPFSTFRDRVLALAHRTLWPSASLQDITVSRLRGGGFNRIIGLDLQTDGPSECKAIRYILRVPRFDAAQVDRDVAALCFIHQHSRIPAPQVISFDETEDNELQCPYMIQNRIVGKDLFSTYPELDHSARCQIAEELGAIFNQMLSLRSSIPGRLALSEDKDINAPLYVVPFHPPGSVLPTQYRDSPSTRSVCELLTADFQALKATALEIDPKNTAISTTMDDFCDMATELDSRGWLAGIPYTLAHLDLAPRNILVDCSPEQPIITAVLDWDSAVLAPIFMCCAPPVWIWAWKDDEDEDERTANEEPPTPEARQLKQLFEDAAGQDYLKFAYEPAYRLSRRLVRFAIDGVRSNEDFKEAKTMLQEWHSMRPIMRA